MVEYRSWGNTLRANHDAFSMGSRFDELPNQSGKKLLAYGMGRSYGDVCLNDQNVLIPTRWLDKFVNFDKAKGILRCEAGVCLSDLLALIIPHGYFVPVTPGTKYVTVGGMVANDVHGKNHHRAGSFGCHIRELVLKRSDGNLTKCSAGENSELFAATIGGIGLTGLVTEVEIQLKPIQSTNIRQETLPFESINEFIRLTNESDENWEYTVAWVDSLADKSRSGRGVFFRGNHSQDDNELITVTSSRKINVPFYLPNGLLNPMVLKYFNKLYAWHNRKNNKIVGYNPFFYPLDSIGSWNRIYGTRGFYQYQCVVPEEDAADVLTALLAVCRQYRLGSFLAVLKKFGDIKSPGILSFPRAGYTLALDFPNVDSKVHQLMDALDKLVRDANGAVYPAKDARMPGEMFKHYYPKWQEFAAFIDPAFSSSFWRRVMAE